MESSSGFQDSHEQEVVSYLTFARLNRNQQLHSIDGSFSNVKDSRLYEDTYTIDEVREILDDLCAVVRSEIESELINASHTTALLLHQLFVQAERWHLQLKTDISELENRKLLEEIAEFEELKLSAKDPRNSDATLPLIAQRSKLAPLNEGGNPVLLNQEIKRLQEENASVTNKLKLIEKQVTSIMDEKVKLKEQLDIAASQPATGKQGSDKQETSSNDSHEEQITILQDGLRKAETVYRKKTTSLEEELTNTKHYVLALQHGIEQLEKELDRKFSESTQYNNMKKMLETKNCQIKKMRLHLKKADPSFEL